MKTRGTTIVLSTHRMESVEELCTHICLINKSRNILEGSVKDIRKSFSTRSYEILFEPGLKAQPVQWDSSRFLLVQEENHGETVTFRVRIQPGASSNSLIASLLDSGTIHTFKEIIPTMNEIFIQTVNSNVPTNHHA